MQINELAGRLDRFRKVAHGWQATCPAHDDTVPSLSIDTGSDGRILLYCHAGCSISSILEALNLKKTDLFNDSSAQNKPRLVATYDYMDENGHLLYQVVRFEPKHFRQRKPNSAGGWTWNTQGLPRLLYRLPQILSAPMTEPVLICEGEKDADRLAALGFCATTNPGGARQWEQVVAHARAVLCGRHILVLPDNDSSGRHHARTVIQSLRDIAMSLSVLDLPGRPDKGDVSDWLDRGGTPQLLRERIAASSATNPAQEGWPTPIPFHNPSPPPFPVEALPPVIGEFVDRLAQSTQTPPDMAATLALTALAAACGGRLVVQASPDYTEPTNLYTLCALPPGNRKSANLRETTRPLEDFERDQATLLAAPIATEQQEIALLHKRKQTAEKRMVSEKDETKALKWADTAKNIAVDLAQRQPPRLPRLLADDATPERLVALLAENRGRLAVLSSEATLLEVVAGRYSNGKPVLEALLKGHAGDTLRVDRVGRSAEFIPQPALTIGLTTQPAQLRGLLDKPGLRAQGLLARFLYTLPTSRLGNRNVDPPPIPPQVRQNYHQLLTKLLNMPSSQTPAHLLLLSPQARQAWLEFAQSIEPRLGPHGDLDHIADWAGKLCGAVLRIAGLLHAATHPEKPWQAPIHVNTLDRATHLATYYLDHAKAAFALMAADAKADAAQHVLRWVERQRFDPFSLRDCFNALRGRFKTVEPLTETLQLLQRHGFIRLRQHHRPGPGRRPSPTYEFNPLAKP